MGNVLDLLHGSQGISALTNNTGIHRGNQGISVATGNAGLNPMINQIRLDGGALPVNTGIRIGGQSVQQPMEDSSPIYNDQNNGGGSYQAAPTPPPPPPKPTVSQADIDAQLSHISALRDRSRALIDQQYQQNYNDLTTQRDIWNRNYNDQSTYYNQGLADQYQQANQRVGQDLRNLRTLLGRNGGANTQAFQQMIPYEVARQGNAMRQQAQQNYKLGMQQLDRANADNQGQYNSAFARLLNQKNNQWQDADRQALDSEYQMRASLGQDPEVLRGLLGRIDSMTISPYFDKSVQATGLPSLAAYDQLMNPPIKSNQSIQDQTTGYYTPITKKKQQIQDGIY